MYIWDQNYASMQLQGTRCHVRLVTVNNTFEIIVFHQKILDVLFHYPGIRVAHADLHPQLRRGLQVIIFLFAIFAINGIKTMVLVDIDIFDIAYSGAI